MENATEPISEEAAAIQQRKLAELRKYNRDYYTLTKRRRSASTVRRPSRASAP